MGYNFVSLAVFVFLFDGFSGFDGIDSVLYVLQRF
jgi:hypothetical protein